MPKPQLFTLLRRTDQTGISGTGRVLDGVIFHTGQVVVCWRSDLNPDDGGYSSIVIYQSWEAFRHVHVDPHPPEQTEIVFGVDSELDTRADFGGKGWKDSKA